MAVMFLGFHRYWAALVTAPLLAGCLSYPGTPSLVVVKRGQPHMGTLVKITAVAQDESTANAAINAGFQEVRRLEQLLSTWVPESELSRVNAAAGREAIKVSWETLSVLNRSLEVARLTEGGFNIALGPAVEAWSVVDRQHLPTEEELRALRPLVDLSHLRLDEQGRTVYLVKPGMRIDVGGIGKGFTADRVVEVMRDAGATAGVVALSGDIKTFGRLPEGDRFPFGIQHPRKPGAVLAVVDLEDEAISTAGDYERYFERGGQRYHHILDPATLHPARGCQSVTVVAKEGVLADGLDTGIFVMGPDQGMALVERLPGVGAVIVDAGGVVHISSRLKGKVRLLEQQ